MGAWTEATLAELEEGERDILRRFDERIERLDARIADGAHVLNEIRDEVEITRISYEHQLALTRRSVERSFRAADRLERTADRVDRSLERNTETLDRATEMLDAVIRALTEGENGPQPT